MSAPIEGTWIVPKSDPSKTCFVRSADDEVFFRLLEGDPPADQLVQLDGQLYVSASWLAKLDPTDTAFRRTCTFYRRKAKEFLRRN